MKSTLPRKERKHAITQLRLLIERNGITQTHIARHLQIKQPSLSKWLNGRSLPGDKWTPRILGYVAEQSPAPSDDPRPEPAPSAPARASLTKKIERARRAVALAASLLDELVEA